MSLGFIMIRHVNSSETNNLWIECYDSIRKYYPLNKILIIDDFSNYTFVDTNKILSNTLIIQSEFKGRGELLPYYYYLQNKLFDYAVVLHDSVFIQKYIDFKCENNFLWTFHHVFNVGIDRDKLVKHLHNQEYIIQLYDKPNLWNGCFGSMCIISHDFLIDINNTFNFTNLINVITDRASRMIFERVWAVLFTLCNQKNNQKTTSLFGDIHAYCTWGQTYDMYLSKKKDNQITLPVEKVWTGR